MWKNKNCHTLKHGDFITDPCFTFWPLAHKSVTFAVRILGILNPTHTAALRSDIYTPCVPVSSHGLIQEGDNGACSSRSVKGITIKCFPLGLKKFMGTDPIISPSV